MRQSHGSKKADDERSGHIDNDGAERELTTNGQRLHRDDIATERSNRAAEHYNEAGRERHAGSLFEVVRNPPAAGCFRRTPTAIIDAVGVTSPAGGFGGTPSPAAANLERRKLHVKSLMTRTAKIRSSAPTRLKKLSYVTLICRRPTTARNLDTAEGFNMNFPRPTAIADWG